MTDKMREEFEAWALTHFINSDSMRPLVRDEEDVSEYRYSRVNMAWVAWQASREALVIELPKIINKDWACDSSECEFMRGGINLTKLSILAAGVKVRP